MRTNCIVCGHAERVPIDFDLSFIVPDGWTLPQVSTVACCARCGMTWYDNDRTQADYDEYYRTKYGYGLDGPDREPRMVWVANYLLSNMRRSCKTILDFGASDTYLTDLLNGYGFDAVPYDLNSVGGELDSRTYDVVIANYVLEHVYDLDDVMTKLTALTNPGGYIYAEVPDHSGFANALPPLFELHQKHINHFRPHNLDTLFGNYGFELTYQEGLVHRNAPQLRRVYRKTPRNFSDMYFNFWDAVTERIARLQEVHGPVIVWGLGDLAWFLLDRVPLNVVYYVDNDPAYRGTTIDGITVYDRVHSDEPIVVMSIQQQGALLKRIREECDNEIIVI